MAATLTGKPETNSKSLELDDDNSNCRETDDQILEKSKMNKKYDPDEKNETFRVVGINGVTYETRDDLIHVSYLDSLIINIEYDDRLALADNKELKKRFKEHVLNNNKGKIVIDFKKQWEADIDEFKMVPTDLILVLRNEDDLDVLKKDMISYFRKKSFTVDIRPISGGEAINFDLKHTPTADGKVVSLKVPVKLYKIFRG